MKSFQERNQAPIGVIGITLVVLGLIVGLNAGDLPILSGGKTYTAHFSESAGLKPDDEVRLAGVKVGKVSSVELAGQHVTVDFRVNDAWIGDQTSASIEIKTLLGQKYLALDPHGERTQDPTEPIPVSRTKSPFDITDATNQLSRTVDAIDTTQLARSFDVISQTFSGSPQHVRSALDGLSSLSSTIAKRDGELARLLSNTRQVTGTIAGRNEEIRKLIADGEVLLRELRDRKTAIHNLLTGTRSLSRELRGLVADNQQTLRPALDRLDRVADVLQRNQDSLARGVKNLAPFVRVFNNTIGNGRWFDAYICGLVPPTAGVGGVNANPEGCLAPPDSAGTAGEKEGPR